MEQRAAHAHAVATVAEHLAWRERTQADETQRVLSQCKVFFALLPDDSALELLAPKPDADDPAARIGVRLRSARRESGASRDTPEKRVGPSVLPDKRCKPPSHAHSLLDNQYHNHDHESDYLANA